MAERERQRACRARRRCGEATAPRAAVSRATLPAEALEILEKILSFLDHSARLSRATLGRELRGILGAKAAIVDQAGP